MEESLAPRSPPGCDGNIMGEPGLCGGMKKVQGKAEVGTDGGGGGGQGTAEEVWGLRKEGAETAWGACRSGGRHGNRDGESRC